MGGVGIWNVRHFRTKVKMMIFGYFFRVAILQMQSTHVALTAYSMYSCMKMFKSKLLCVCAMEERDQ